MHTTLASLLVAAMAFGSSALAFNSGDALTPDAIGKAELIQGEVPKAWEPGKVYIIECWATWCGPCVAAIPHVDGLYDKYQDKGLRVIGVNVWEDGKDKVSGFVKQKGDGMSYPVVYTGKTGSAFESDWLKPGNVNGIPHAFVLKDGKFLFSTHPAALDEETIEALLAGGEKQDAVVKRISEGKAASDKVENLMTDFMKAQEAGDANKMAEIAAAVEKLDAHAAFLPMIRSAVMIAKKDWAGLEKQVPGMGGDDAVLSLAFGLDGETGVPESLTKAVTSKLAEEASKNASAPVLIMLSRYQWKTGDKDAAKVSAHKALDDPGEFPKAPLKKYTDAVDAGDGMSLKDAFSMEEDEGE